jgi:hypothetical protein
VSSLFPSHFSSLTSGAHIPILMLIVLGKYVLFKRDYIVRDLRKMRVSLRSPFSEKKKSLRTSLTKPPHKAYA